MTFTQLFNGGNMTPLKIVLAMFMSFQMFAQVEQSNDAYNKLGLPAFYYEILNYKSDNPSRLNTADNFRLVLYDCFILRFGSVQCFFNIRA